MIDKLNKLDLNLNKLEELDKSKFSSNNFKDVNQQLEAILSQILSSMNIESEKTLSTDEQVFLENILSKIEKLETKILPKANLLNSFSQSIT
ncbi:MAG: hypothetical protein ACJZ80_02160 [Candidatus Puniceispirillales bacterium]